jgi:hypothetical protein
MGFVVLKKASKYFVLISSILLLNISICLACVWVPEDGATVYWPSTTIPVCFIEQDARAISRKGNTTFSNDLSESRQIMTQALREMSQKTRFNLHGFGQCDPNDSSPMIRINFTRNAGDGEAESIGPNSARKRPYNISVSQVPTPHVQSRVSERTGLPESFDHAAWAKTAVQHEVMHLLGFHHDTPRGTSEWNRFVAAQGQTQRIDEEFDQHSVMNITGHGKELSDRDIACINDLAMRTIRYNSVTTNPLLTSTPTTDTPDANQTPPTSTKPRLNQNTSLTPIGEPAAID